MEAALERCSEHLREMISGCKILQKIQENLQEEASTTKKKKRKSGKSHYAVIYKVTLNKPGASGHGISYHGQAVRNSGSPSDLAAIFGRRTLPTGRREHARRCRRARSDRNDPFEHPNHLLRGPKIDGSARAQ